MGLSLFAIQNAKPKEKPYMLLDRDGLHLRVQPNGVKLWRFRYRFDGKQLMLGFGSFPEITLAQARDKRDEARKLVAQGINPSQQRKDEKRAAATSAANSFEVVAKELIEKLEAEGIADATGYKKRWLLLDLARPLCLKPIKDITSADILALLKAVEKTGRRESALRLRSSIGQVFRYAISTLRCEIDPTYALRGALAKPKVKHRAALTDEKEVGALWASINAYDGWPTLKAAMQLAMLTMARPTEIRHLKRNQIDFAKAKWIVPAPRMKMRLEHDVPLSRQALAVLREVWDLFPQSEYVLPSIRSWKRPLSENAMNSALRRMGYTKFEQTSHGFRTCASTILNDRGLDPTFGDVIELALAHQEQDEVRAAYNRARYWKPRVKLLQDWADLLDQLQQPRTRAA